MLAYLDALIAALSVRDAAEVDRLLAHPLARILPDAARDEARALGAGDALAAPLRVMQLRHLTAELLRELPDAPVLADRSEASDAPAVADVPRDARRQNPTMPRRNGRLVQMELPLSA
jgi:hypothetical protein